MPRNKSRGVVVEPERKLVEKLEETPLQNAIYNVVENWGVPGKIVKEDWILNISMGQEAEFKSMEKGFPVYKISIEFINKRKKQNI